MAVGQEQCYHFGVGAPPIILVYFSGWIGIFTGGTIWILTHGHVALDSHALRFKSSGHRGADDARHQDAVGGHQRVLMRTLVDWTVGRSASGIGHGVLHVTYHLKQGQANLARGLWSQWKGIEGS